jgi:hypothetical protein
MIWLKSLHSRYSRISGTNRVHVILAGDLRSRRQECTAFSGSLDEPLSRLKNALDQRGKLKTSAVAPTMQGLVQLDRSDE